MPRATTQTGALAILDNCRIQTYWGDIELRVLPEISDTKKATYHNENIIGRSSPLVIYSHSEARTISMELTFLTTELADIDRNLHYLRLLESLVYPGDPTSAPYSPPQIAHIVCGNLLGSLDDGANSPGGVCCILESYSVKFPTDVAWDEVTYLPYKFTVSTSWQVVYACKDLPCNQRIIALGR
jgi:hypothetical protein